MKRRVVLGGPQALIQQWLQAATDIRWINSDQPEPTAPRPNIDPAVDTYGALGLDEHEGQQSTPYRTVTDQLLAESVTWTVTGTPAEGDGYGITINDIFVPYYATAGQDAAAVAAALRAALIAALAAEPVTVGGTGADVTATADDPDDPFKYDSGYETQTPPPTSGLDEDAMLTGYAVRYTSIMRRGQLDLELFGPDAFEQAILVQSALGDQPYLDAFGAAGVALTFSGNMTDEEMLRSAAREPDVGLVFAVDWTSVVEDSVLTTAETNLETTASSAA